MDCVGCEKCRLWGKLQVLGLGTALKILFSVDGQENLGQTVSTFAGDFCFFFPSWLLPLCMSPRTIASTVTFKCILCHYNLKPDLRHI